MHDCHNVAQNIIVARAVSGANFIGELLIWKCFSQINRNRNRNRNRNCNRRNEDICTKCCQLYLGELIPNKGKKSRVEKIETDLAILFS